MDALVKELERLNDKYDESVHMLKTPVNDVGYHSHLRAEFSHGTRPSLNYALMLLCEGSDSSVKRAADVIDAVLSLQCTDPYDSRFGIWPWHLEESLDQMNPPDWNWADFCGASLLDALISFGNLMPDGLRARVRTAVRRAAYSIFRRNVGPDYSNIAVLGGVVCGLAGETLDDGLLLEYGKRRLSVFLERAVRVGGVEEYNSPTYNMVIISEISRLISLGKDETLVKTGRDIFDFVWQGIAEHYHPATGQWAGPHCRAYSDLLTPGMAALLACATGYTVGGITPEKASEMVASKPLACPELARKSFSPDAAPEGAVVRRFAEAGCAESEVWGTTWFDGDMVLGTVNHENTWVQRHPVIAYWKADGGIAVMRVRLLREGKDFASGLLHTVQNANAFVSGLMLLTDRGDFHNHLDHPADGLFHMSDLRLRIELCSPNAELAVSSENSAVLSSGKRDVVVHFAGGAFNGANVRWQCGRKENAVFADVVFYDGDNAAFDLSALGETWAFAGAVLVRGGKRREENIRTVMDCRRDGVRVECEWPEYGISAAQGAFPMKYEDAVKSGKPFLRRC